MLRIEPSTFVSKIDILTTTPIVHKKRSDPIGCPCTTARKEAKGVRSDARHQSHFHTTLQKYRSKIAATQ